MWTSHYHSLKPKYTNYSANGTGRDTYINFNNGGYFYPSLKNPGNKRGLIRPKTACNSISMKSLHYHSDGTGRDGYVVADDGGLHTPALKGNAQLHFQGSLRSYPSRPLSSTQPTRGGVALLRDRSRRIQRCIGRLYPGP